MTESMIEKVARAIYDSEGNQTKEPGKNWRPSRLEDDENKELYLDYARAAIEAMREPSSRMVGAATGVPIQSNVVSETYVLDEEATAIWQGMITAALEENGE
ncbi:hypothetical protein IB238_09150 [Rhizobium sp. ARZ01]|uniref:hypothetical protein n=1 Tax=Rhizobium sp. ARZ01 TaxID=2769313 RepID=UPI0017807EA8|nr:hypothetical protein [Rhizobium sp. ARZ01]MBD9372785.1 hypothetical protein [Rhizobium sp. ARZ01]